MKELKNWLESFSKVELYKEGSKILLSIVLITFLYTITGALKYGWGFFTIFLGASVYLLYSGMKEKEKEKEKTDEQ